MKSVLTDTELDDPNALPRKDYGSAPALDAGDLSGVLDSKPGDPAAAPGAAPAAPDPNDEVEDRTADLPF